jgi:photosystem II stability/assembly factor-like uncharacterized protein
MSRSPVFAAVASLFTHKDRPGLTGVFRRDGSSQWRHVLEGLSVFSLRVDPRDPQRVLAGTADGVWRSTDSGRTFSRTRFPDAGVEIWSFLFDAGGTRGRLLAGGAPLSVFASDDDGESWERLADPVLPECIAMPFGARVTRLAPDPAKADEIYASLEVRGVMRSTDGGESWSDCTAHLIKLAEQEPRLRNRVVTENDAEGMLDVHSICTSAADPAGATIAARTGLFRSDDHGSTWSDVRIDRFAPFSYAHDLRVSPNDPATFYACMSDSAMSKNGALFRSRDAGRSWHRFDKVEPGGTLMAVCEDPANPARVHFATRYGQVFGTEDGGASWESMPLPSGLRHVYDLACG